MKFIPTSKRFKFPSGFTLLELLVVLAILAVIATGIAGTYGRKNIDEAKDKMTLHEMQEIKKAFLHFETHNCQRLREEIVDINGNTLPSADFDSTLASGHIEDAPIDRLMEFYESYGLWFLMVPRITDLPDTSLDSVDEYRFPVFKPYNALETEGWNGPYLDTSNREAWNLGTETVPINLPQIGTKYGGTVDADDNPLGVYRLLYFVHCEDLADDSEPVYRRLLLISPREGSEWDELGELLPEAGNLRAGGDLGRFDPATGSFTNDDNSPYLILELKNMDFLPE